MKRKKKRQIEREIVKEKLNAEKKKEMQKMRER